MAGALQRTNWQPGGKAGTAAQASGGRPPSSLYPFKPETGRLDGFAPFFTPREKGSVEEWFTRTQVPRFTPGRGQNHATYAVAN